MGKGGSLIYQAKDSDKWQSEEPACPDPVVEDTKSVTELAEYWQDLLPGLQLPRMEEEQLREFVLGVLDGRIFIDKQVAPMSTLPMVFMPLAFGIFGGYNPESLKIIGCFYEYHTAALSRSINGYPCFASVRMLHIDDWTRAAKAISAEQERRKSIPI